MKLPSSSLGRRILMAIPMVVAFLVMASVFTPDRTQANERRAAPVDANAAEPGERDDASPDPHAGLTPLGALETTDYTIEIYAGRDGPRYTVIDEGSGAYLATLITVEKVAEYFQDLQLPNALAEKSATFILADHPATDGY